jgi:hypothetical protein
MSGEKRTALTRSEIIKVKTRALRRGMWFRALTKMDRACVDLAIIVVERVRSRLLRRVLFSVIKRLEEFMESQVQRLMREVGADLARKISRVAQKWGNKSAVVWAFDSGFVRYLTISYMNMSTCGGWR